MPKSASKNDSKAVDVYLGGLPVPQRAALEALRAFIKRTVPGVQERISYGGAVIFARRLDLVGLVARNDHLSFLTMSPELARSMKPAIAKTHRLSGATIHLDAEKPLPLTLVRKILKARIAEQDAGQR